ncbi:unnamed protein product, partial [Cyprideis torosa]
FAQVATNTETSNKNVGNAILYETVLTIMDINSESGLRVLAVNILGRFLLNSDKNIRYVALNTLLKTVQGDVTAVQRHRGTILGCLKDTDVSIQRRALDLSFALVNATNIRSIIEDLIVFLRETTDRDFKMSCSGRIVSVADKFAPNRQWHLDVLLDVLKAAGDHVREDAIAHTIQLLSESDEPLRRHCVQSLWKALQENPGQPLIQVAVWSLGEHGELLQDMENASPDQVLDVYRKILYSRHSSIATKEFALTSLMKLSTRYPPTVTPAIRDIISSFGCHLDVELQQRGVEFTSLFRSYDHLRSALLERIPVIQTKPKSSSPPNPSMPNGPPVKATTESEIDLLDSEDIGGISGTSDSVATDDPNVLIRIMEGTNMLNSPPSTTASSSVAPTENILDWLSDLPSTNQVTGAPPTTNQMTAPPPQAPPTQTLTAYDRHGLRIDFVAYRDPVDSQTLVVESTVQNTNLLSPVTEFLLQAAVPKAFQLQILVPSGSEIPAAGGKPISQVIKVTRSNSTTSPPLRMRLKVSFSLDGKPITDQAEVSGFRADLW